jgi:hypothetical protein
MLPNNLNKKLPHPPIELVAEYFHQLRKKFMLHLQQRKECAIAVASSEPLNIIGNLLRGSLHEKVKG